MCPFDIIILFFFCFLITYISNIDKYSVLVLDELKADAIRMSPPIECSLINQHRTEMYISSSSIMPTTDTYSQALILHPKCNKPAVLRKLERIIKVENLLAKQRQTTNMMISREAIALPATSHEELDAQSLMTLQVLSARASTPYTQPSSLLSCTAGSCDLLHLSPPPVIKKPMPPASGPQIPKRSIPSTTTPGGLRVPKLRNAQSAMSLLVSSSKIATSFQCYTRQHLLDIRNGMIQSMLHRSKESLSFSMPRIATCDDIELEARLRRMNLWRSADASARTTGHSSFKQRSNMHISNNNSSGNECMPAFYNKNKSKQQLQQITDESIIQSQPPQPQQEFQVCNFCAHQTFIYIVVHIMLMLIS